MKLNTVPKCLLFLPIIIVQAVYVNLDFASEGCVDPTGVDSCMSTAAQSLLTCVSRCGVDSDCVNAGTCGPISDNTCVAACFCTTHADRLNCALSGCWNKVSAITSINAWHPIK